MRGRIRKRKRRKEEKKKRRKEEKKKRRKRMGEKKKPFVHKFGDNKQEGERESPRGDRKAQRRTVVEGV